MYADSLPRKRKREEAREPIAGKIFKFLWRALAGLFHLIVTKPARALWRATVWTIKAPFRAAGWLLRGIYRLIVGTPPEFETTREREIYRRIRRRYRRRNRLITHLFVFGLMMGTTWISWLSSVSDWANRWREPYTGQIIGVTLLWAFFLIFHFIRYRMSEAEDNALEAALEREYAREARQQPVYYEEVEEYYGDAAHYPDG